MDQNPHRGKSHRAFDAGRAIRAMTCACALLAMTLLPRSAAAAEPGGEDTGLALCKPQACCEIHDSNAEDKNAPEDGLGGLSPHCAAAASLQEIPNDTNPCKNPQYWPLSVASARYPIRVHYRRPDERAMALTAIKYVDTAWQFEVETLGFSPPLADRGHCGPDGFFDVFLWRGREQCWVDEIAGAPVTSWGGRMSYMVVDPWGRNGKDILRQTIGHELNHASQAADNWDIPQSVMEMTATYVEQYFRDALLYNIKDFQEHPEYGLLWLDLDQDGNLKTYYMYGAALYLYFLRDKYFQDDAQFAARFWKNARPQADPAQEKATVIAAFDTLLAPKGSSFLQSVQEFARWRAYAGSRDDGRHFKHWPVPFNQLPFLSQSGVKLDGTVQFAGRETAYTIQQAPMILGSAYVDVVANPPNIMSFELSLRPPAVAGARWVVQAVPGLTGQDDGEAVDLSSGSARVKLASVDGEKRRTLIFTLLPDGGRYDPAVQDTPTHFPYYATHPLEIMLRP